MKSAMLVTWACLTLLVFGVVSATKAKPPDDPTLHQSGHYELGDEVWSEDAPVPVSTDQPPIVWITHRPDHCCTIDTLEDPYQTGSIRVTLEALEDTCPAQMEQAMRAIDKYIPAFVDPAERRRSEQYNRGIIMDDLVCRSPWCGGGITYHDPRSIEERLEADRRRYEREQEDLGRQIVGDERERFAYQQWATVKKECWGKP